MLPVGFCLRVFFIDFFAPSFFHTVAETMEKIQIIKKLDFFGLLFQKSIYGIYYKIEAENEDVL